MPAKTKQALLDATRTEFAKLDAQIAALPEEAAGVADGDDTSIRDVVAHRAHWIGLFLGWYADGMAGRPVYFPAEGYKWSDLKRYNADLRARQAGQSWDDARRALAARHRALMDFLEGASEADLYGGPMKGARNHWTPGRWAEAAGASHYRSARTYIRGRLKALRDAPPAGGAG